ncbi:MAG: flagellar hook-basal body protein [Paenibacillaceae bacterium]
MNHSMISASASMNGLLQKLDVIANNMANQNTDGYKRKEASFEDLLTTIKQQHASQQLTGRQSPLGLTLGSGARLSQIQINMAQGVLKTTENPYDLAIEGDALFEIGLRTTDADGNAITRPAWTRNGALRVALIEGDNQNSMLTISDGSPLIGTDNQPILVPNGRQISIDQQGNIIATQPNNPQGAAEIVGRIKIVRATRPQLLESRGDNLYVLPDVLSTPGQVEQVMEQLDLTLYEEGSAPVRIRQGFLEGSNVDFAAEMSELIQVQRAFQLNAKAISSSDTLMNLANTLRG